jgi:hypothetical protein
MSTFSSLKIELIGTGEQNNTWGTTNNTNLGTAIQEAIVGRANAVFTADSDLTLTLTDTSATQVARNFVLNVTSSVSLTATRNLIVPVLSGIYVFQKPYIVQNNTTGGQSIIIKTASGTGVTIPNGSKAFCYADGTNVSAIFDYMPSLALGTALPLTSGGTGATNAANARSNLGLQSGAITTVGSMATQNSNSVAITGGSIANITPLEVASGGTGGSTASTARANLLAAQSGINADISQLAALTAPITIAQGGTGASSASAGRTALGAAASGTNSDITALTASPTITTPTINSGTINTSTMVSSTVQKPLGSGCKLVVYAGGTINTGTTTIDLSIAQSYTYTITNGATITFAFSNAPSASQSEVIILRLTNAGSGTLVWPAGTKFQSGDSTLGGLTAAGIDMLGVYYDVTSTSYMVFVIGRNMS